MQPSKQNEAGPPAYTPGAPASTGMPMVYTQQQQPQQPYPVAQQPQQFQQQPQQPYVVAQQPQQFQQQQPLVQQHNLVVVQAAPQIHGRQSANVVCHVCHQHVQTRTVSQLKSEAWVWAAVLCFFGGLLCVWIPFVLDSNYSVTHHCPSCNTMLAQIA